MNNNIIVTEDYCSFEVSKLLKEKGFRQKTLCFFFEDGEFRQNLLVETTGMDYGSKFTTEYSELNEDWNNGFLTKKDGSRCFGCNKNKGYLETCSSPTHTLAIKWIRENFGVHIFTDFGIGWEAIIIPVGYIGKGTFPELGQISNYSTPEEALEAALLYTLKNLIP